MPLNEDNARRMLGEIQELYDDAAQHFRSKRLDRAAEAAALYRGWHHSGRLGDYNVSTVDPQGEALEQVPLVSFLVRAAAAHTLKQAINIEVPAAKGDPRSRARAKNTERLAQSLLRTKLDPDEIRRAVLWSKQTGAAWMKVCWDKNLGRVVDTGADGFTDEEFAPRDDGFGGSAVPIQRLGDIRAEFIPTTDGYPDPAARAKMEMQHFFHVKLLPIRKLEDRFPTDYFGESTVGRFDIGGMTEEQATFAHIGDDEEYFASRGSSYRSGGNTLATVVEFWELPTSKYPRGRFIAYSDSTIIAMGPNPYYPARLPFVLIPGDKIIPGSLYPDGLVEDVRGLQYSANRALSKMREWVDKMLNTHLLVPSQANIDKNIWGDKPGQIISYQKGYKPEPLEVPDIPQSMFEYLDQQIERAKSLTGYTDVGRGEVSDLSGRAVAFATQNEEALREPDMAAFRQSVVEIAQHMVYLARQFYDEGRMVSLLADSGQLEIQEFLSDEYDWDTDLVPEATSNRPQSHAARLSEVLELADAGLFEDGSSAERARRLLGQDYAAALTYDPFQADRARARRENLSVLNDPMGSSIAVQTYDTHKIHLEEHYDFMRSPEFEALPDWQRALMLTHCELHEYLGLAAGLISDELANGAGDPSAPPPAGAPPGSAPPGPPPSPPGAESPQDGGAGNAPAPPPAAADFASMSESDQRSSDQR